METCERRRSLVGPLILIGLGVIFLLNNLGMLGWSVWETLWKLWPVLLIAIGLEVLLGRGTAWGALVVVLIVFGLAGIMSIISSVHIGDGPPIAFGRTMTDERISEPLGGVKGADITLEAGVGELRVGPAQDTAVLAQGTISLANGERLERDFHVAGDKGYLTLKSHGVFNFPVRGQHHRRWDLSLSPKVPMVLRINTGVGVSDLDLRDLQATEIEVKTGVGKTTLVLPAKGQVRGRFEGGIGETTIYVPRGMAARIRIQNGIGAVEVDGDFMQRDGAYVSPDFDTAKNRVDLEVKGGIGKIAIETDAWR